MALSFLNAARLAMGRDVQRWSARAICGKRIGRQTHGCTGIWADSQYLLLVAQKRIGNVAYGVAKAATDRMTAYMAEELQPHGVAVMSLYPGVVRTESVTRAAAFLDLSNSESPQFIGRAVAALASDPDVIKRTGTVCVAAALAQEYGFDDIDGKMPVPLSMEDV